MKRTLVTATVWDGDGREAIQTAERFGAGLVRALRLRHGSPPTGDGNLRIFSRSSELCSIVSTDGPTVVYLESVNCSTGPEVAGEIHEQLRGSPCN